jgi:hypothetical protein
MYDVDCYVCTGSLAAVLSEIEQLKSSADALESELASASAAAEGAAKRSRRLAARSHELQVSFGCKGWREEFGQGGMEGGIGRLGWGRGGIIVVMERGG